MEQPDGTLVRYSGFKKGSIFVELGQTVLPYTPLGVLDHYDVDNIYELRLMIYFNKDKKMPEDDDVKIKDYKDNHGYVNPYFNTDGGYTKLVSNKDYTSVFSGFIHDYEMSKRELKAIGKKSRDLNDLKYLKPKNNTKGEIKTTYYDKFSLKFSSKELAETYEETRSDSINTNKRYFRSYYLSGKLKREGIEIVKTDTIKKNCFCERDLDTGIVWMVDGNMKDWYENGQIKIDVNFVNGRTNGKKVTYWDNGQIKRTNIDKNGLIGDDICYDPKGRRIKTYPYARGAHRVEEGSINDYLKTVIVYPKDALNKKLRGFVWLRFV